MSTKPSSIESLVDANGAVPVSFGAGSSIINGQQTNVIYNGTTALTPKFALANVAQSQTDSVVVAAVSAKKIRVLSWILFGGATATGVTFNSKPAGAGTAISPLFALGANNGAGMGFSPVGHFETGAGEGLSVTTGAGGTTGIQVTYVEV